MITSILTLLLMAALDDGRNIQAGSVIPDEGYADQPYVVKAPDGAWLCVLTTGPGVEGEGGQHVIAVRSTDFGKSWSAPVPVEPGRGPEASWAVPFLTPYGRIYVFYTYNRDNIRKVPEVPQPAIAARVDTLGSFAFKYSDDGGRTWSRERYEIPMRRIAADMENNFGGRTVFFWSVGKPLGDRGIFFLPFAKVTRWGMPGTLARSRGFLMRSGNLLTERDPARIQWIMLPEGDEGLVAPKGPISEETNITTLSDGSLYAIYRTIDGYICHAYSRDQGRTWTPPAYATFSPDGRPIKNPRAFSFVRRFSNGKYLLWFHNQGGEAAHVRENWDYYADRNPAWVSGGIERAGHIWWSEPEILLYDENPKTRMSYPDWIEDSGRFFITETQKTVARVHEVDRGMLEGLWSQFEPGRVAQGAQEYSGSQIDMPDLDVHGGFALDFWMRLKELSPGQVILDARNPEGKGVALELSNRFSLRLTLGDGKTQSNWESDCGTGPGTLRVNRWQHVSAIVDGGPGIVMFVVDGVLNDGGPGRQFGWGRFDPSTGDVNGARRAILGRKLTGEIRHFRIYPRRLRVSEAVGNYHAGM